MGCKCYDIAKSAGSQTNKSSKRDSMTPEFYKNVYQKTYPNDFRLGILENKKVLENSKIEWKQLLLPSLPSRINSLVIAVKNCAF